MYFTAKRLIPSDKSNGYIGYSGLYENDYAYVFKLLNVLF